MLVTNRLNSTFIEFPSRNIALFGWRDSKTGRFKSFTKVFKIGRIGTKRKIVAMRNI